MYKVTNKLVPSYISDLIPPTTRDISRYELRNRDNIAIPFSRTDISQKSCIPSSIALWNNLDQNLRTADTLISFKNKVKNTNTVPRFYLMGDIFLMVHHARIRNNCSNLNHDLFINHLRPDSLCHCSNGDEGASHFFFECTSYTNQRIILFRSTRSVHPLSIDKVLLGDRNRTDEENISLFRAVHQYIKSTNRFTRN